MQINNFVPFIIIIIIYFFNFKKYILYKNIDKN